MGGKFELQVEDNEYYLVDGKTNDTIATTDKVLLKEYDGYMKKLSIKNCEAIANGYDVFELAYDSSKEFLIESTHSPSFTFGYEQGFQKALEILGDKKFSVKDMEKLMFATIEFTEQKEGETYPFLKSFIRSLQQTEWDVEIVTEKDCYSSAGICDKSTMAGCIICTPVTYLLDENGCLILRKI